MLWESRGGKIILIGRVRRGNESRVIYLIPTYREETKDILGAQNDLKRGIWENSGYVQAAMAREKGLVFEILKEGAAGKKAKVSGGVGCLFGGEC